MLACFIRNSFILLGAIYIFYKLLNISPNSKRIQILLCCISIIISVGSAILFLSNQSINWLVMFLLFFIMMKSITKINLYTSYTAALFSFALSFIALSFSGIITSLVFFLFYFEKSQTPWSLIRLCGGIISFLLIYCCFRIPRLKKGMSFLYNLPSNNIGSSICMFLFMAILMSSQAKSFIEVYMLGFNFLILIFTLILFYWWNYHLTQTYRKYLRRNELATLEMLLLEKDTEITHLKSDNDTLSRLIHKDNKILPALTMAVENFLQNANKLPPTELEQLGSSLQTQLNLLYDDRLTILNSYEQELFPLPSTGFTSINAVLLFMQQKASQAGIQFQCILSDSPSTVIPNKLPEKAFSHLLSDLLDNAVIAAGSFPSSIIRIHMGFFDNIYTLKIFNTGQPFSMEVLQDMGIVRHTTHGDTGGSGIGMIDIWKLKEQYSFTLLVDETTDNSLGTSSTTINILFNNKNHYIIQTDRYKELVESLNRPDLRILSKD